MHAMGRRAHFIRKARPPFHTARFRSVENTAKSIGQNRLRTLAKSNGWSAYDDRPDLTLSLWWDRTGRRDKQKHQIEARIVRGRQIVLISVPIGLPPASRLDSRSGGQRMSTTDEQQRKLKSRGAFFFGRKPITTLPSAQRSSRPLEVLTEALGDSAS